DKNSGRIFITISLEISVRKLVAEATHKLPGNSLSWERFQKDTRDLVCFSHYTAGVPGWLPLFTTLVFPFRAEMQNTCGRKPGCAVVLRGGNLSLPRKSEACAGIAACL